MLIACAMLIGAGDALSQQCDSVTSRVSLGDFEGDSIRSLSIRTFSPPPLPEVVRAIDRLHARTRTSTIRRQLLFRSAQRIDTLAIAESLRRLRRLRYLSDIWISAVRCFGHPGTDLIAYARDAWSTRPSVSVRSSWAVRASCASVRMGFGFRVWVSLDPRP
jgi:hypothetical protein